MGMRRIPSIPDFAEEAANHIIVVCLDCEHWSNNTDETTEVGIATFCRQDIVSVMNTGDIGAYGEKLMQKVQFYLLRLIETSHLPNQNPKSRGVLGNRFGQGRFVTFSEARQIMHDLFLQPIYNVPGLKGNHPIVVLGHDVGHDRNNLKKKAIEFDMDPLGTVVRYVDTQVLARDRNEWYMPGKHQIGLCNLVENLFFEHSDPHTAANDAGRTLISAFQLGLGRHECRNQPGKTMKEVAASIEEYSVANFKSIGGVKEYCWRCGKRGHMKSACTAIDLYCEECKKNNCKLQPGEDHITAHCMCIANAKAVLRRARDAEARALKKQKNKPVPRGRSLSYHGRPLQRDRYSRSSRSGSQTPRPRQIHGRDSTFSNRKGKFSDENWRDRSNSSPSKGFNKNSGNVSRNGSRKGFHKGSRNGSSHGSGHGSSRRNSPEDHWSRDGSE